MAEVMINLDVGDECPLCRSGTVEEGAFWKELVCAGECGNGFPIYGYSSVPPNTTEGGPHNLQQIVLDPRGTPRFRENQLVTYLLEAGPFDMNKLAVLPNISRFDRAQFAQLIGYSVSGYGDLSYSVQVAAADAIADELASKP